MTAAEMLKRALTGTQGHRPQQVTDEFAKSIAKKLRARGIANVPIDDDPPQPRWYDRAIGFAREQREIQADSERRKAEAEAAESAPKTTAGILAAAIAGSSTTVPLNGAGVLRAALSGMGERGTINGGTG